MLHPSPSVTGSRHVTVDTQDGVRLAGIVVPAAPEAGPRPPTFVVVHGFTGCFALEHLRALVRAAGPTSTAWVVPGFGHAESGATAPLVERTGRWVSATIGP